MASIEKRMQILVVDDDDTLRAALRDFLTQKGMIVNTSRDGAEAIQVIKNRAEPFDVVITDLIMPNAGGLDVLREARDRFSNTSCDHHGICLSGNSHRFHAPRGLRLCYQAI